MPSVSCKDRDTDKTRARNKEREKLVGLEKKCSSVTDPRHSGTSHNPTQRLGDARENTEACLGFIYLLRC